MARDGEDPARVAESFPHWHVLASDGRQPHAVVPGFPSENSKEAVEAAGGWRRRTLLRMVGAR